MKTASQTRRAFIHASAAAVAMRRKCGTDVAALDGRLVRETLSRQNADPFTES
jgi:hypothetical protein